MCDTVPRVNDTFSVSRWALSVRHVQRECATRSAQLIVRVCDTFSTSVRHIDTATAHDLPDSDACRPLSRCTEFEGRAVAHQMCEAERFIKRSSRFKKGAPLERSCSVVEALSTELACSPVAREKPDIANGMWSEVQKLAEVDKSLERRDIGIELLQGSRGRSSMVDKVESKITA